MLFLDHSYSVLCDLTTDPKLAQRSNFNLSFQINLKFVSNSSFQALRQVCGERCETGGILVTLVSNMVHSEFIPCGETVNVELYSNFLGLLKKNIQQKWCELWSMSASHLLSAQSTLKTQEFLDRSPVLLPCIFILFTKMKIKLQVHRYDTGGEYCRGLNAMSHNRTSTKIAVVLKTGDDCKISQIQIR